MTTNGTAMLTLPTDRQILITREFDAPRHLVWRAWTTPELVARWWHAKRGEVTASGVQSCPGNGPFDQLSAKNAGRATTVVQRYLIHPARDVPVEPGVRAFLDQPGCRLRLLCAILLHWGSS